MSEAWNVAGKTVLVTGGNSGIGRATTLELARRGAQVVFTARDGTKGAVALGELRSELGPEAKGSVDWMMLDLASFKSILSFVEAFKQTYPALHVLVHNAGLVLTERCETVDGFEATFGTNHMGPFTLNRLLLPVLKASAPARIVVVASDAHRMAKSGLDFDDLQAKREYKGVLAYGRSKLANILFTSSMSKRLVGTGVTINCLHPGVVATGFARDGDASGLWGFFFRWARPFLLTAEKGARTSVYLAASPDVSGVSGSYFARSNASVPSSAALDENAAEQLWEISEALCAGASLEPF